MAVFRSTINHIFSFFILFYFFLFYSLMFYISKSVRICPWTKSMLISICKYNNNRTQRTTIKRWLFSGECSRKKRKFKRMNKNEMKNSNFQFFCHSNSFFSWLIWFVFALRISKQIENWLRRRQFRCCRETEKERKKEKKNGAVSELRPTKLTQFSVIENH